MGTATHKSAAIEEAEVQARTGFRGATDLAFFAIAVTLVAVLLLRPVLIPLHFEGDHYLHLARSFTQGKLSVDTLPDGIQDYVWWNGHKYLPLGPLPGVLLIPFLPFFSTSTTSTTSTTQDIAWVGALFTLVNAWLFYVLLGCLGVPGERRKWGVVMMFGGTVYLSIAAVGTSWFFAQITALTFLLAAICFSVRERRNPVLAGLFVGLAGLARLTILFAFPFFLWTLRYLPQVAKAEVGDPIKPEDWKQTTMRWAQFASGLLVPLSVMFLYNHVRFGSPVDTGYGHAVLTDPVLAQALAAGIFSPVHVPKNLFMFLLQGPAPFPSADAPVLQFPYVWFSPWGLGILYTSPFLVYAFRRFKSRIRLPLAQASWASVLLIMVPVMSYYGIGWVQFGFRYALDFMPFLVVLACTAMPDPMPRPARWLVFIAVTVNLIGAFYLWTMV